VILWRTSGGQISSSLVGQIACKIYQSICIHIGDSKLDNLWWTCNSLRYETWNSWSPAWRISGSYLNTPMCEMHSVLGKATGWHSLRLTKSTVPLRNMRTKICVTDVLTTISFFLQKPLSNDGAGWNIFVVTLEKTIDQTGKMFTSLIPAVINVHDII